MSRFTSWCQKMKWHKLLNPAREDYEIRGFRVPIAIGTR